MLRTPGGVKSREVYGAVVQLGTSSPPGRFFRRGIDKDCIVPEPADDMETAVAHRRDECALEKNASATTRLDIRCICSRLFIR